MRFFFLYILLLILTTFFSSCKEKESPHVLERFYTLEVTTNEEPLKSLRKRKVPFFYNSIIDPFHLKHKTGLSKSTYEYKPGGSAKVYLLKNFSFSMNTAIRERKEELSKATPLIIQNDHPTDTLFLKLFQGKAIIIQEALHKQKWKDIERMAQSKMGYYYYKVYPNEYIYTKIPVYQGKIKTKVRAKVYINDSTIITTGSFNGKINYSQVR